jgi:putative pyruvate formate lyase activating enzyme
MTGDIYTRDEIALLSECTLCPRECRVNRFEGGTGYCGSDAGMNIASICIHRGEEPPVSGPEGICNIFFSGCNLKCIYCQNHDISRPCSQEYRRSLSLNETLDTITEILAQGIKAIGFVSPSHVVPQVRGIIRGLNARGFNPVTVYNTNSYDKPEVIDSLDGMIDVYLPDY